MAQTKKALKYWGIAVQVLTYIANGILWCLAVYASGFAIVIGLSSRTISTEDGDILDWIILTPATIFLVYGIPLLVVATFGCFASVSANKVSIVIYVVLIILFIVYDVAFGISLMQGGDAYGRFILSLKESQWRYGDADPEGVGVISVHPKEYWDHLHRRGKCCGLYSFEDWKNTSMAKEFFSIPDSCCNELYDYIGCGQLVWKHPDHEQHTIESIVFERGCLTIFPAYIQNDENENIAHLGRFLIAMLFIAMLSAIVLFALVLTRSFRSSIGINNPDFIDAPADPSLLFGREVQVYPDSRGDRDDDKENANDTRERKISFDDKGPTLIPEKERQDTSKKQKKRTSPQENDESPPMSGRNRRE